LDVLPRVYHLNSLLNKTQQLDHIKANPEGCYVVEHEST